MKFKSVAFVWTAVICIGGDLWGQNPISPALLEANLGPIAIDFYDGSSPNAAASPYGVKNGPAACAASYRACVQSVLSGYNAQPIVR